MAIELNSKTLEKINKLTRRELSADEVFCFEVILCDNDVDRDYEKFSVKSLEKLSELFLGKTGIFNHDPKGENQTARIYDTEVLSDPERKTSDGEIYTYLKAYAYMVRTDKNSDLIREIDAGIKKEVSVGCAVAKRICSVCGADRTLSPCAHKKGRTYSSKSCHHILAEPTDAYEWSFVAVPAQRRAGVTKVYSDAFKKSVTFEDSLIEELCTDIKKDILKLSFLQGDNIPVALTKSAIERMDIRELLMLKKALEKEPKASGESVIASGLASKSAKENLDNFKL